MNVVCFQYLRTGTEEVADRAPVVAAGRKRGYDVVEGLGLLGSTTDPEVIRKKFDEVLGANGTKLCLIQKVISKPNGGYELHITEAADTAGNASGEPVCAFTMGVFIGAIHAITGTRMQGHETQCSACGAEECIYQIDPV
jgi:hypothetical protein